MRRFIATFRLIYVKAGQIVGEGSYSSRLPGSVMLLVDLPDRITQDMARFGADGYGTQHNHPSGRASRRWYWRTRTKGTVAGPYADRRTLQVEPEGPRAREGGAYCVRTRALLRTTPPV
ncbi:MAG TPA: hypothetical protein VJ673_06565 [Aromatoleum sp.]|nr:hypothetical protein [Aromatoleum sp.]